MSVYACGQRRQLGYVWERCCKVLIPHERALALIHSYTLAAFLPRKPLYVRHQRHHHLHDHYPVLFSLSLPLTPSLTLSLSLNVYSSLCLPTYLPICFPIWLYLPSSLFSISRDMCAHTSIFQSVLCTSLSPLLYSLTHCLSVVLCRLILDSGDLFSGVVTACI